MIAFKCPFLLACQLCLRSFTATGEQLAVEQQPGVFPGWTEAESRGRGPQAEAYYRNTGENWTQENWQKQWEDGGSIGC